MTVIVYHSMPEVIRAVCLPRAPQDGHDKILVRSWAAGEEAEVKAAWLPFPALTFELLPQVYRREGETTYRYESDGGRFVRTLEVAASGFVTSYPGLWAAEVE